MSEWPPKRPEATEADVRRLVRPLPSGWTYSYYHTLNLPHETRVPPPHDDPHQHSLTKKVKP